MADNQENQIDPIDDPNMPARKIMMKWGKNATFAKAIRRSPSTTYRYLMNGYFVGSDLDRLYRDIIAAAKRDGHSITPDDFINLAVFETPAAPELEAA